MGANKIIENISQNKIATIVAVVFIVIVLWYVGRKFLNKMERNPDKDVIKDVKNEIVKNNLSYDMSQYEAFSDTLFEAFTPSSWQGTDEESVYRILRKLINKDDWKQLIVAFGTRESPFWYSRFDGNLIQWLESELDTPEKTIVNGILEKIGVSI